MPEPLNLAEAFARIDRTWSPRSAASVNGTEVRLVRLLGEFVWHRHEDEDELFLVVKGRLLMRFRDGDRWVGEGEMILVPRGVEHCPVAPEEVHVVLVEPASTVNTGSAGGPRTAEVRPLG